MELEKIREILAELLSVDISTLTAKTNFVKDLGMDSLDVFQFISEVESAFDIEVAPQAAAKIKTLEDAANYIIKSS